MPALIAIAAGAVLKVPLLTALFGETSRPRLRPVVMLVAVVILLAAHVASRADRGRKLTTYFLTAISLRATNHLHCCCAAEVIQNLPSKSITELTRKKLASFFLGRPDHRFFHTLARIHRRTRPIPKVYAVSAWVRACVSGGRPRKPARTFAWYYAHSFLSRHSLAGQRMPA
jgi:hypothetical protein